jgi:RNA polymerase sigma factor (sigma-70 family)
MLTFSGEPIRRSQGFATPVETLLHSLQDAALRAGRRIPIWRLCTMSETNDPAADLRLVQQFLRDPTGMADRMVERLQIVPRVLVVLNRRYGRPLDDHELDDLVQDTILRLLGKLAEYRGIGSFDGFCYRHCEFEARNRMRRIRKLPKPVAEVPDVVASEDTSERLAEHERIREALERVGGSEAEVLHLRLVEGLAFDVIAARLGLAEANVKSRYYRGLDRLKRILGDPEQEGDVR